jgi:radical SAM superfamily enzyme YgiQ (UPF0313 family)
MANLGVHAVYRLANADPRVRCERVFLPEDGGAPRSVESGAPLASFDAVAFSLSFEDDAVRVLALLDGARIPLRASDRRPSDPLVLGGGIALQVNPEPLAPFLDAVAVGDAEPVLPPLLEALRAGLASGAPRAARVRALAELPFVYVPALYDVAYTGTRPEERGAPGEGAGWVTRFAPRDGAPARVRRAFATDLSAGGAARAVETPGALFGDLHLVELARGCLWGCRFCAAGFVQRPYREVGLEALREEAARGVAAGARIGLVGPDAGDHAGLDALTCAISDAGGAFSPSSLRVDALTPALAARLAAGGERTVTVAPEAGTERLRRVLNKDFPDDLVVRAAEAALAAGMANVKAYFMCGLPGETEDDVAGIARLALRIREEALLPWARRRGTMGRLTLSVNPFVPKPWTPFQWAGLAEKGALEAKRRLLERTLRPKGIEVEFLSHREALPQAVLSRGDRRAADLLEAAHRDHGGDLRRALARWAHDPAFFAYRVAGQDEVLPWDFLDHGVEKAWLAREWRRGLAGEVTPRCRPESCRACGLDCADLGRAPGA